MKFLIRILLLLVVIAIGTAWYLLRADGRELNWRNIAELPDLRPPAISWPDWEEIRTRFRDEPGNDTNRPRRNEAWVTRPGEEPAAFAPFVPGPGVSPRFPPGTFFRWQDAQGVWHYDAQPQPGVRNHPVATDPQRNIVPAGR